MSVLMAPWEKVSRKFAGKKLKAFLLEERDRFRFASELKICTENAYLHITMCSRSMVPDDSTGRAPVAAEMYSS